MPIEVIPAKEGIHAPANVFPPETFLVPDENYFNARGLTIF